MIQEKDTKRIKAILRESVNKYYDFYNGNLKKFPDYEKYSLEKKATCPYVCWNESDLRTYIIHIFLNEIENTSIDIGFVHSEFQMKPGKFDQYETMNQIWDKAVSEVRKSKGRKRNAGDIDIAITSSQDEIPFILCVEVKFYHYALKTFKKELGDQLKQSLKTLQILKQHSITQEILMIVGDLYYHRKEPDFINEFYQKNSNDLLYLKM
jgi:hypothetical protein